MNTNRDLMLIRQKAIRAMLAGLLGSELSTRELQMLGYELDIGLLKTLRMHLGDYLKLQDGYYEYPDNEVSVRFHRNDGLMVAERIYLLAKEKRISKDRLRRYLSQFGGEIDLQPFEGNISLKEIIYHFVEIAGEENALMLMQKLAGSIEEDPYLHGISGSNRK